MADNNKKKNALGNIQKSVLVRTLFPMLLMGIIIAISSVGIFKSTIRNEMAGSLKTTALMTADMYDMVYPGQYELRGDATVSLYKGEYELTGQFDLIDRIKKQTSYDVTLFYGNTRILTTLKDEYGNRFIVTGLNAGILNEIASTEQTVFHEVDIEGRMYYACYVPIYDDKSELVCIIGTAVLSREISELAIRSIAPIWIIALLCMILSALISYNYTGSLVGAIKKIDGFLKSMTKGELSNDMPVDVMNRKDELGTTAKAVTEMQNAIRVLVERDPLTQLYNRRYGGARLRKIQSSCEKNGVPYAVVLGDIDFFKKVNDTYGHEAGDIVLKKVSEIMRKHMAGKGFVARWGGEEFLVIFSKYGAEQAAKEMEDILNKIRKQEILCDGQIIKVTMSFGVVDGSVSNDFSELLRRADERLYFGKTHGRNRIITTDEIDDDTESKQPVPAKEPEKTEPEKTGPEKQPEAANDTNNKTDAPQQNNEAEMSPIEKDLSAVIDDAFLEQLIEKMNEKLYRETLGGDEK